MKDFLLIANTNACTYKEFSPLLKEGKARGGYTFNKTMMFETPEGEKSGPNIAWFTSLPTPNKKKLVLTKKYHHVLYPHYDNYRAIEVSRIKDIPYDYECLMAVPITIFQYNLDNIVVKIDQQPERPLRKQIDIRGIWGNHREESEFIVTGTPTYVDEKNKSYQGPVLNGKMKYARVVISLIRRKAL